MRLTYQSALTLSLPAIADIHTASFGGGWRSDPDKLADIVRIQSVDLRLSLIAYDGRKPVGIAFLGRRRAHGWLYDFAIAPAYRGQGVGTRLLTTLTREAIKAGVRDIELDVWEKRDDAIRLYERAGFTYRRSYLNFQATGAELELNAALPTRWQVRPCAVEEVVSWYAAAREHEPDPCWDRCLPSLLTYGDAQACIVDDEQGPAACLHYAARTADGHDPDRIRPMFVGLRPAATLDHLRALFAAAAAAAFSDIDRTVFRVALEPDQSTLSQLLAGLGMRAAGRALDMRLSLRQEHI